MIKSRPNLLTWYTADEPDGTSDPLNATLIASKLVQSLDGGDGQGGAGYHPVTLVLNCENYFFTYVEHLKIPEKRCIYPESFLQRVHEWRGYCHAGHIHDRKQRNVLDTVVHPLHGELWRLRVRLADLDSLGCV